MAGPQEEPTEEPSESGTPRAPGDDRLRAAVAAWVASADERDEGDEGDQDGEGAEGTTGAGSAKRAGSGASEAAEASEGDREAAGAAGDAGAAGGAEVAGDGEHARADADAEVSDADAEVEDKTEVPGADADVATTDAVTPDDAVTDDADGVDAGDAGDASGNAEPEAAEPEAAEPKAAPEPEASPEPEAVEPDAEPADKPAEPRTPAPKPADSKTTQLKVPQPGAAPSVDSPTTAFQVLRPPLDHPTTALKTLNVPAGPSTPLSKRPTGIDIRKPSGDSRGATESAAERTSTFVPLRPLEDRAAPKWATAGSPAVKPQDAPAEDAAAEDAAAEDAAAKDAPAKNVAAPRTAPETPAAGPELTSPSSTTGELSPSATVGPEYTRQQPLPPKPPLDLLAELTNTPPPPETPMRTAVRRVKIWTPLVVLLVIVFGVVQAVRPLPQPTLALTASDTFSFGGAAPKLPWPAKGQAAMDVDGLGSFGASGEQKPVPIASVAKVMTAYLVMRDHPVKAGKDGAEITMDQKAEDDAGLSAQNESTVEVKKGQKLTQKEAMEAIMIASANNIARQLARWDAGSEQAFVAKMNKTAGELGMKNTKYTDPSGLNKTTVSTAEDQVKLGKQAMKDPLFREVVRMPSYTDSNGKKQGNWNQLVPMNNTVGIKTGTTTAAGGNLLYAATKDVGGTTRTIIGAVLAQPPSPVDNSILTGALTAGSTLIKAAQGELEAKKVVKKGDVVGRVEDGLGGSTPVVATKDVTAVGWSGLTVKLRLVDKDGAAVPHEAKAGTAVGVLRVGDGSSGAVEVPVALRSDLSEPGFGAKLTRVG